MTDLEFEVLDELYFVISFEDLAKKVELEPDILRETLIGLHNKKWIKALISHDEEILAPDIQNHCEQYFYLATKLGLLEHNQT